MAFRFHFDQGLEMAARLHLFAPQSVLVRRETAKAKTDYLVVCFRPAPRSLPGIDLSYFAVFDPCRSRVASVIDRLFRLRRTAVLAAASVAAVPGPVVAAAVVLVVSPARVAVVSFDLVRLNRTSDSAFLACSYLAVVEEVRIAAPVVSCFLIPRSFSLHNRNSLSPRCSAVRA